MTTSEILNAAADLIEKTGWTRRAFARDANGDMVNICDDRAACFCVLGAIRRVGGFESGATAAKHALQDALYVPPQDWNDEAGRTKEEVIAKLREVAALESVTA